MLYHQLYLLYFLKTKQDIADIVVVDKVEG